MTRDPYHHFPMPPAIDIHRGSEVEWAAWSGKRRRAFVRLLQKGRCYLCGKGFEAPNAARPRYMAVKLWRSLGPSEDHVWPQALRGGREWNLLLAHVGCNSRRGDRLPYPCELILLASVNLALRFRGPRNGR